jgi:tetratricopeptide (TPR) repeat protein
MPTRVEILHTRERADRALRAGRPREALSHYWQLLESVKATRAHYESWMDGAVGAYLALNRTREAGYMLLGLRRYAEAQRHFPAAERPLEWALCAAKLGHHGDAARVLSESGRPVLAALELEAAGASAAARLEWERVLVDPRLVGRPYETALGHFNLGEALLRIGDRQGGARAFSEAQRLLETAADDFETRGEPVRAFDCYSVLLRLGKATDSFENVSEGYLNAIRVLAAEDQLLAMQYYDDFLTYAIDRREWHAAAMAAREAANYSLRAGKPYDRHYLGVAVEAWTRAARDNQANDGPVDLSANALHAAIDAATALGDLESCSRLYAEMAELPIVEKRRLRYRLLAERYAALPPEVRPPAVSFPEHLRRTDVYTDIWRQDLIELELAGDPTAVLARHVADHPPSAGEHSRQALRALLLCGRPDFSTENVQVASELALTLGQGAVYEMLSPLERLYEHPVAEVRAAVLRGAGKVYLARSYGLIRKGLTDPAVPVFNEALRVLREMHFVDGIEPATRIFRESTDERVRLAALEGIGGGENHKPAAAALVLLEAVRQETGPVRAAAEALLARFSGDEMVTLIRQARDAEIGDRREILDRVLRAVH